MSYTLAEARQEVRWLVDETSPQYRVTGSLLVWQP